MSFKASITKRVRKRKLKSGEVVKQQRWVLNYNEPHSGQRRQEFFETLRAAEARRADLTARVMSDAYVDERKVPTVDQAIDHWLADRDGKVKANTLAGYKVVVEHIRGPYFEGSAKDKLAWKASGKLPKGCRLVPMLGPIKTSELATARIRTWHRELTALSGQYTANRAKSHLVSILALNEEDYRVRAPSMPRGLGRNRVRVKKVILSPAEIGTLVEAAQSDPEHGIYYAFAFLAGTRPSEQLGLLWEDIDFEANLIRIRRIQERTGSLTNMTKTEAGTREIPMSAVLRAMLLDWRVRCPRRGKELHRVFPGPGRLQPWPKAARIGGGGPLLYQNFRHRYWQPVFQKLGLPYVTPHSARHSFISTLQAEGIEVGLVAKLAGHANATVTLGHYTQAVRGGGGAGPGLRCGQVERAESQVDRARACGQPRAGWAVGRPLLPVTICGPGGFNGARRDPASGAISACPPQNYARPPGVFRSSSGHDGDDAMDQYRLIDLRTQALTIVTLERAAELAEIDADEIVWAIEAEGICETDLHVIAAMDEPGVL